MRRSGFFRLGLPPAGGYHTADAIRQALIAAPWLAVRRVFDTALANNVDFLLMTGRTLETGTCPGRAISFLVDQFRRLEGAGISVHWCADNSVDSSLRALRSIVPANVSIITAGASSALRSRASRMPVGSLSRPSPGAAGEIPVVASISIPLCETVTRSSNVAGRYIARTGVPATRSPAEGIVEHNPGSPQARGYAEAGQGHCTIARFGPDGAWSIRPMTSCAVQWISEQIQVSRGATPDSIVSSVHDRTRTLVSSGDDLGVLIDWTLSGNADVVLNEFGPTVCSRILAQLRSAAGDAIPFQWHASLQPGREQVFRRTTAESPVWISDFFRRADEMTLPPSAQFRRNGRDAMSRAHAFREVIRTGVEVLR